MRSPLPSVLQVIVVALLCASSHAAGAARQEQTQDPETPGVLRVQTRLVQVDVVVRNDDGPVGDLTPEDFTLYADGERQDLAVFEVSRAGPLEVPPTSADTPMPEGRVVSNRPGGRDGDQSSATVVLLDRLNTEVLDQPRANAQLLEFLEGLDPRHAVAIYELRGQLRLVQDYTTDRHTLLSAARSLGIDFSSQLDASYGENVTGGFEAGPNEVGLDPELVNARLGEGIEARGTAQIDQFVASLYVNDRIRVTAEVLEYVALNMAGLAGRKNLIWLSGRFPFSFEPRSDFTSQEVSGRLTQLERTARALTDANVAIYPISAVGLLAPEFNAPGAALFPTTTNVGGRLAREPASTNTMPQIARMTGGEAHYLTNGLAEAMLTATEDAEVIYTLAFYPDAVSPDDAFHDLRVEVARDGVEVRHRRGYYGFGIPDGSEESARVPAVNLVASPVNATGIGLTARTVPSASVEEGSITYLSADVGDLRLRLGEDRWVGSVEIATLIIEANGSDPRVDVGTLDIVLTPEAYQEAVAAGVYELLRLGSIGAGPAWLRIVVREPTSGAAGSLWVAFE